MPTTLHPAVKLVFQSPMMYLVLLDTLAKDAPLVSYYIYKSNKSTGMRLNLCIAFVITPDDPIRLKPTRMKHFVFYKGENSSI